MALTFYDRLRIVCLAIPAGRVATYGQLAMLCGRPANSRQVGYGLNRGLAGPDVPAHRVVNSRGQLTGAKCFGIENLQQELLRAEGVPVTAVPGGWQVDLKTWGWQTTEADAREFLAWFARAETGES